MTGRLRISGRVLKFPGKGGWFYLNIPERHTKKLKEQRHSWGEYPVKARVGNTSWNTKLMMKKGGDFFIALKKEV